MEKSNLPPRRTRSKSRLLLFFLLLVCFVTSAVAGAMFAMSSSLDSKRKVPFTQIERERVNESEELIKAKDKATILILGVDIREDDVGRSDTMMIATIDPMYDQASLLSIPRDTRVRIYGYGFDKINAAYAYGGEPLAEKTVENFLGIDIDHYVIVNVHSFVKIIDAIGGVDIYVPKRMYYEDPWDDDGGLVIDLYPGRQHMDGKTAVTYVRYRDSEGDIGRVQRQQQFMEACMDKITSPEIITHIPDIIREVMYAVDTDMTFRELLGFAGALKAAQSNGLVTDMVPGYPLYIDEISYWIPDVEEIQYAMAEGLGFSVDANLRRRTERVANEYRDSIPDNAVEIPEGAENIGTSTRRNTERDYTRYDYGDYDDANSRRESSETHEETRRGTSYERENSSYDNDRTISSRPSQNQSAYDYDSGESRQSSREENLRDDRNSSRETNSRHYDEQNYSTDRTNEETRAYERQYTRETETRRGIEHNEPFDVPSRDDSAKTRN